MTVNHHRYQGCSQTRVASRSQHSFLLIKQIGSWPENCTESRHYPLLRSLSTHHLKSRRQEIQRGCTKKREGEKSEVCQPDLRSQADVYLNSADFTGITAPYEAPELPEIHIKTNEVEVADAVRIIVGYLTEKEFI